MTSDQIFQNLINAYSEVTPVSARVLVAGEESNPRVRFGLVAKLSQTHVTLLTYNNGYRTARLSDVTEVYPNA